jgi:serine/threonine protein kinase
MIGKVFNNRYKVIEQIGRGGMSEVYKVFDSERNIDLALKLLHRDIAQDRVFLRRFKREAATLAKLQHPNIVRFYGVEQDSKDSYMLMDYVDGDSLKAEIFLLEGHPMPSARVVSIMRDITSAIQYAHNRGYVHSDLKPGNILLSGQGQAQIADFGIARMTDAATATMVGAGTPAYMSPEQIRGKDPIPQSDIYSLGIILYEMVTGGERPFTGEMAQITGSTSEKVRWEHLKLKPEDVLSDLTDEVQAFAPIILGCLQKDRRKRYKSILAVWADIEETALDIDLEAEVEGEAVKTEEDGIGEFVDKADPPDLDENEHLEMLIPTKNKSNNKIWVILGLGAAFAGAAILFINGVLLVNPFSSDQTAQPTSTTRGVTTSNVQQSTATSQSSSSGLTGLSGFTHCRKWNTIDQGDNEREMCVFGVIREISSDGSSYYVYFSSERGSETNDFRVVSFEHFYSTISVGDCVAISGTVRSYGANSYVYIDPASTRYPGTVHSWEDGNYCK